MTLILWIITNPIIIVSITGVDIRIVACLLDRQSNRSL
jgi:hypothetical protein